MIAVNPEAMRALQQENVRLRNENRTLKEELLQLRHALRALSRMGKRIDDIHPETDVLSLINDILHYALRAVNSENGSLLLLDEESNELVFVEASSPYRQELIGLRIPADLGIAGAVVSSRTPTLVPDVRMEPKWSPFIDERIGFQTLSLMCVPVTDGERVLGAIEVVNTRSGDPFEEEDLDILVLVARLAATAIIRAEKFSD